MASKWYLEQELNKIGLGLCSDFIDYQERREDTRLYTIITGNLVVHFCTWGELQALTDRGVRQLVATQVATGSYKNQAMQGFIERGTNYVSQTIDKEEALRFFVDMEGDKVCFMGVKRKDLAVKLIRLQCGMLS